MLVGADRIPSSVRAAGQLPVFFLDARHRLGYFRRLKLLRGQSSGGMMRGETAPSASGRLSFEHWYAFSEGGPVEAASLPFPADAAAPFEVARWMVAPGVDGLTS